MACLGFNNLGNLQCDFLSWWFTMSSVILPTGHISTPYSLPDCMAPSIGAHAHSRPSAQDAHRCSQPHTKLVASPHAIWWDNRSRLGEWLLEPNKA